MSKRFIVIAGSGYILPENWIRYTLIVCAIINKQAIVVIGTIRFDSNSQKISTVFRLSLFRQIFSFNDL